MHLLIWRLSGVNKRMRRAASLHRQAGAKLTRLIQESSKFSDLPYVSPRLQSVDDH